MATTPLFVADTPTLKAQLRLSGVYATAEDVQKIIERALLRNRLEMQRRLGDAVIAALLLTVYNENPTNEAERRRAIANLLEIEMVKCLLLCELRVLFLDSSGSTREDWNENGVFRSRDDASHRNKSEVCCDQDFIEEAIAILTGASPVQDWHLFSTAAGCCPVVPTLPTSCDSGSCCRTCGAQGEECCC